MASGPCDFVAGAWPRARGDDPRALVASGSCDFVAGAWPWRSRRCPAVSGLRAAGEGARSKTNAPARRTRAWTPPGAGTGTVKQLGTPARAARSRGSFGHRAQGTATADGLWLDPRIAELA